MDEFASGDELRRWLAAAADDEAARSRARARSLVEQAAEDAVLSGVLTDLAERGQPVSVGTALGSHHGRIVQVGRDFVAVVTGAHAVLVSSRHLCVVRTADRRPPSLDDRRVDHAPTLSGVLGRAAVDRPRVRIGTVGHTTTGELRAVGDDVIVLITDGQTPAYVPLAAVVDVAILDVV